MGKKQPDWVKDSETQRNNLAIQKENAKLFLLEAQKLTIAMNHGPVKKLMVIKGLQENLCFLDSFLHASKNQTKLLKQMKTFILKINTQVLTTSLMEMNFMVKMKNLWI